MGTDELAWWGRDSFCSPPGGRRIGRAPRRERGAPAQGRAHGSIARRPGHRRDSNSLSSRFYNALLSKQSPVLSGIRFLDKCSCGDRQIVMQIVHSIRLLHSIRQKTSHFASTHSPCPMSLLLACSSPPLHLTPHLTPHLPLTSSSPHLSHGVAFSGCDSRGDRLAAAPSPCCAPRGESPPDCAVALKEVGTIEYESAELGLTTWHMGCRRGGGVRCKVEVKRA